MSDLYLIVKRGLYYRPNSCGYTGIKDEAGRYSLAEVAERFPNTDSANQDGITFVAEADAPDYSEACYWDTKLKHQHDKAQAEITRLTEALAVRDALIRDMVAAVKHEREMVCQDMGLQLEASKAVDTVLARADEALK